MLQFKKSEEKPDDYVQITDINHVIRDTDLVETRPSLAHPFGFRKPEKESIGDRIHNYPSLNYFCRRDELPKLMKTVIVVEYFNTETGHVKEVGEKHVVSSHWVKTGRTRIIKYPVEAS